MSASLVGSEMCIRDRVERDRTPGAGLLVRGPIHDSTHHAQLAGSPAPVSYTHLTLPTICSV
eukprot:8969656-Alexandrium_andersonii.AAC.1